jgi:modulator of FtsH protease HflC
MMRSSWILSGALIALALFIAYGTFFSVNQTEQALVFQFGKVQPPVREPGLNFKIPLIQNVEYFDRRVLDYDPPSRSSIR